MFLHYLLTFNTVKTVNKLYVTFPSTNFYLLLTMTRAIEIVSKISETRVLDLYICAITTTRSFPKFSLPRFQRAIEFVSRRIYEHRAIVLEGDNSRETISDCQPKARSENPVRKNGRRKEISDKRNG